MKSILMATATVLAFTSISFGQAAPKADNALSQTARFLPTGTHEGLMRSSLLGLKGCTVLVGPTKDNGGGLIADIRTTGGLISDGKSIASMSVYYTDLWTSDTAVTANQAVIGYLTETSNASSKTLKIEKLANDQARVTITESFQGKEINKTSCRIKVK